MVDGRSRLSDWELDTIIGKGHKQAIVSITKLHQPIADRINTLISDNDKEFAGHETIAKGLNARFFFAHPYASWERGLNGNTNGLIRQYFPKHRDFTSITQEEINQVMEELNNHPRKCLGRKAPNQVFFGVNPPIALVS
nr:IS30 family transposase [Sedimenticola thiotaurini]